MKPMKILWQILFIVGVGQKSIASKVQPGGTNESHGYRQSGISSRSQASNNPDHNVAGSEMKNYFYKTGVVDEDRGFMQGRTERKIGDQVVGSYEYADGHVKVKVLYKADDNGYRVLKEEREPLKPLKRPKGPKIEKQNRRKQPLKRVKNVPITHATIQNNFPSSEYSSEADNSEQTFHPDGFEVITDHSSGHSTQEFIGNNFNDKNPKTYLKYTSESPSGPMNFNVNDNPNEEPMLQKQPLPARAAYRKGYKGFWRKNPKSKPQTDDSLAIFYKELYPLKTVLFSPYEAVSPVRGKMVSGAKYFEPIQTTTRPDMVR